MSDTSVKHPDVHVNLASLDGNAFAILGAVTKAMQRAGVPDSEQRAYYHEATSGDYDHLLQVTMATVETGGCPSEED